MTDVYIRSNVWMIDRMEYYLTQGLQATSEESEYLKTLCVLKSKPRNPAIKPQGPRKPSTIIDGFLYHGDLGHAQNKALLNELGIQHIVNVCDSPLGEDIVGHFSILWININDALGVDIRQHFDRTNSFLHTCKAKGEKVLVHCQMGISRSSSIVLACLLKYHYDSLHEAYDHLVQCRRVAAPNFGFFLQLMRYEKDLNKKSKATGQDQLVIELAVPIE